MGCAIEQLENVLPLACQVVCRIRRQVYAGKLVPALGKIVSIFEFHTDIICKDRREPITATRYA